MSPLEKFFANLRRLLEPRTQPPAETREQPSADRPPPSDQPSPEPTAVIIPSAEALSEVEDDAPSEVQDDAPSEVEDDALSEVRAALEAVAEPPAAASVPEAEAPIAASDQPVDIPPAEPEPAPAVPPALNDEAVDVPDAAGPVAGALILTLATPAATFTVARTGATLGRGEENTIRLDDLSVSRRHARIAYRQGGYWLSDLGSMGGTWVQGTRLNAPRKVAAGDLVDIGLYRLTVSFAADEVTPPTKKSASRPRSEMAGQARRRR